jgi:hypothetical protein
MEAKLLYHYILVREDLPYPVQMVNVAHAAGESIIDAPIPSTTIAVILHVKDEAHLFEYADLIKNKDFPHVIIREPDEPYNNAAMSIGLQPNDRRNALRKLFYHLNLVK